MTKLMKNDSGILKVILCHSSLTVWRQGAQGHGTYPSKGKSLWGSIKRVLQPQLTSLQSPRHSSNLKPWKRARRGRHIAQLLKTTITSSPAQTSVQPSPGLVPPETVSSVPAPGTKDRPGGARQGRQLVLIHHACICLPRCPRAQGRCPPPSSPPCGAQSQRQGCRAPSSAASARWQGTHGGLCDFPRLLCGTTQHQTYPRLSFHGLNGIFHHFW